MPTNGTKSKLAVAALALTLTLSGCSMDTTSPGAVRDKAGKAGQAGSDAKTPAAAAAAAGVDCEKAKCIALTFDAGPGKDTPQLLDTLQKEKVPATFFLLGKNHVLSTPTSYAASPTRGTRWPTTPGPTAGSTS